MSELLPTEVIKKLPRLYSQELAKDPLVHVHLYSTGSERWDWYIIEGQEKDEGVILFAWVAGWEEEMGYVSLLELEAVNNRAIQLKLAVPPGVFVIPGPTLKDIIHDGGIVRDTSWRLMPLSTVKKLHRGKRHDF